MRLLIGWLLCASAWGQFFPFPGPGNPAVAAPSGPTFVQASQADATGGAGDQVATFGVGSTSGNGGVVFATWSVTSSPSPATGDVTDASGDTFTYQFDLYDSTDGVALALYLAPTLTAGTTAITFKNFTNTTALKYNGYPSIIAFEVHGGTRAVDGSATNHMATGSASANGDVCATFTPATSGDLILMGGVGAFQATPLAAGTSPLTFTIPANGSGTNIKAAFEYAAQTSAAAIIPAMTGSGTTSNPFNSVCLGLK